MTDQQTWDEIDNPGISDYQDSTDDFFPTDDLPGINDYPLDEMSGNNSDPQTVDSDEENEPLFGKLITCLLHRSSIILANNFMIVYRTYVLCKVYLVHHNLKWQIICIT